MKTVVLTRENFLKYMDKVEEFYYVYICKKVFNSKEARYIYGKVLWEEEADEIYRKMWKIALKEQKKNPLLTHILVPVD